MSQVGGRCSGQMSYVLLIGRFFLLRRCLSHFICITLWVGVIRSSSTSPFSYMQALLSPGYSGPDRLVHVAACMQPRSFFTNHAPPRCRTLHGLMTQRKRLAKRVYDMHVPHRNSYAIRPIGMQRYAPMNYKLSHMTYYKQHMDQSRKLTVNYIIMAVPVGVDL